MNKLTTKEAIEKAAKPFIKEFYKGDFETSEAEFNEDAVKVFNDFANRVLEDMQEEVSKAKDEMIEYRNRVMGLQTLYDMNTEKIETLTTKLTTTRADTLKEVLAWVKDNARDEENDLDSMDLEFNLAHQEIIDYLNKLLNQKP
jgi:capsule polysaccharide export protein KpsE/RkpR